jgi:6-phosphofructokinase 1
MIKFGNNAIVGQSGGPTAAINSSLCGVISGALQNNSIHKIYGMANGIDGFLKERLYDLTALFKDNKDDLEILKNTPGAALGSCRFKLPKIDADKEFYENLFSLLKKYEIGYFFYIGGNDSMDTTAKVSAYAKANGIDLKVVGVPKTVDNDLCGTDHTPGFGSAAKYVATTLAELKRDTAVYTQKCATVVEVMGRDAGWLTAAASLSNTAYTKGADLIYLPELPFSYDNFYADVEKVWNDHPDALIAVSEGIRLENGTYIGADGSNVDKFGHVQLSGAAAVLVAKLKERFGCKVRSIELNTPQRCASHCASLTDITESFEVGAHAVKAATSGETGVMAAIIRESDAPYTVSYKSLDVQTIANQVKAVPREYINNDGNGITESGVNYLRPLILGENEIKYQNGIPMQYIFPKI